MTAKKVTDLHPNTQMIIRAIQSAARILDVSKHVILIGSLAKLLNSKPAAVGVGDVDVFLERPVCEQYWRFVEILTLHGLRSVYDVLNRPKFNWNPCRLDIGHARLFTVDCSAHGMASCKGFEGFKHVTLDIVFKADDLAVIPDSSTWAEQMLWNEWREEDEKEILKEAQSQNKKLEKGLRDDEKKIPKNRTLDADTGLLYAHD